MSNGSLKNFSANKTGEFRMSLVSIGLLFNLLGTLLLALFGTTVTQYGKDGTEAFYVQTGDESKKYEYTFQLIMRFIGWFSLILGFVLQLINELIK